MYTYFLIQKTTERAKMQRMRDWREKKKQERISKTAVGPVYISMPVVYAVE